MVETLSINVSVLSINAEHNFIVPKDMSVGNATLLIVQALAEEYAGIHQSRMKKNDLIQMRTGKMLPSGYSFRQLGITQGDEFVLV